MSVREPQANRRDLLRLAGAGLGVWVCGCVGAPRRPTSETTDRPQWLQGADVLFEPIEILRPPAPGYPGEHLSIRAVLRGRLERRSGARGAPWPEQPLLACLASLPEGQPDWSQPAGSAWVRQYDCERGVQFGLGERIDIECQLSTDGRFQGSFPVRLIQRRVEGVGVHPVALGLPDGTDRVRVLGSTQTAIEIPGVARASLTQLRIHAVAGPGQAVHDPVALVRAVNQLRGLGREGALSALEDYLNRLGRDEVWPQRPPLPGNLDSGSPGSVFLIVPLLFEPLAGRPAAPEFSFSTLEPRPRPPLESWPGYPLKQVGDLPFLMGDFAALRSWPDSDPRRHLEWARNSARLRPLPLVPASDPLRLLWQLEQIPGLPGGNSPRLQLMRAFAPILGFEFDERRGPPLALESGLAWQQFEDLLDARRWLWDSGAQTYRSS